MGKDKVVIIVVFTIVFSAIIFGILMAYRTYKLPMRVNNIEDTINILMEDSSEDEYFRMVRLSMFNELSRSCKMRDNNTGEIREFSKEDMEKIYNAIGGKEAVIEYLKSIKDEEEQRRTLEEACYNLKVITDEELINIWNQRK